MQRIAISEKFVSVEAALETHPTIVIVLRFFLSVFIFRKYPQWLRMYWLEVSP